MVRFICTLQDANLDLEYHLFPPTKPLHNTVIYCNLPVIEDFIKILSDGVYYDYAKDNDKYLNTYLIFYTLAYGKPATKDDALELMNQRQALYSRIRIVKEHIPVSKVIIDPVHWVHHHLSESFNGTVRFKSRSRMIREAVKFASPETKFIISETNRETRKIKKILNDIKLLERIDENVYKRLPVKRNYFIGELKK